MDHSYSLDPCLEQSILDTFEHTIRLHDGPDHYLGRHLQLEWVQNSIDHLDSQWYYRSARSWFDNKHNPFQKRVDTILNKPWVIEKQGEKEIIPPSVEDILLLTGVRTAELFEPTEAFWKQWFSLGFRNPNDYVGSLWVVMEHYWWKSACCHESKNQTYFSQRKHGVQIKTNVTGDPHGDFRITQIDTTPYKTISPLGSRSSFRPILESDELHLSPFHTQELAFFCILLRYAEQSRQTEIFLSTITNIIHQTKYKIQQLSASGSRLLANRQRHIPKSKDISMSRFALMALDGTAYLAAIDADGSLIFCHQKTPNTVCARFYPRELPDLIQALFAHALSGTGRISPENLVEIFSAYQAQNS